MYLLEYKIFQRKLKMNSMSIRKGNVEYIIAQKDHKRRHQKCSFHWSIPLSFTCLTRSTIRDARNTFQI